MRFRLSALDAAISRRTRVNLGALLLREVESGLVQECAAQYPCEEALVGMQARTAEAWPSA